MPQAIVSPQGERAISSTREIALSQRQAATGHALRWRQLPRSAEIESRQMHIAKRDAEQPSRLLGVEPHRPNRQRHRAPVEAARHRPRRPPGAPYDRYTWRITPLERARDAVQ